MKPILKLVFKAKYSKNPEPSAKTGFRFLKTGSETGLYRKVLGNVASAKWRRNILGCTDPWEGHPVLDSRS